MARARVKVRFGEDLSPEVFGDIPLGGDAYQQLETTLGGFPAEWCAAIALLDTTEYLLWNEGSPTVLVTEAGLGLRIN